MTEETRSNIFNKLRNIVAQYCPPMVVSADKENVIYEIIGNKAVPYGYDKKIVAGMYFATIAQRKNTVTFHFFPSYMDNSYKEAAPAIYACLKGKTCFHFSKVEQVNEEELHAMLKHAIQNWKTIGYLQ
ncbi:MAG: DUF1801 domain-containing protein [Bacteroidota bacterium]